MKILKASKIPNPAAEPKPRFSHESIAATARQLWQNEGCQPGRDEHYWLKAEQQLLAAQHQGNGGANPAAAVSQNKKRPVMKGLQNA